MNQIQIDKNQALPTQLKNNGLYDIKKFVTTRATLFNEKIFMEISIPVVDRREYTLYKAIPTPAKINDHNFIQTPNSKYFLLNKQHNYYIPMTETDLRSCLNFDENTLICKPVSPVYHNPNTVCELATFNNESADSISKLCTFENVPKSNYVIQINEQDKYFVSIFTPISVVNSCGDGRVEMHKIIESGILTVEPDCIISTDEFQIRPHEHKYFNNTKIIIPKNDLNGLTFEKYKNRNFTTPTNRGTVMIQDYEREFGELIDGANAMLERESEDVKFERINYDTMTHSYAMMIIFSIVILLAAGTAFIIYKKVNPLSTLLSLITGIPETNNTDGTGQRNIVINVERPQLEPENN